MTGALHALESLLERAKSTRCIERLECLEDLDESKHFAFPREAIVCEFVIGTRPGGGEDLTLGGLLEVHSVTEELHEHGQVEIVATLLLIEVLGKRAVLLEEEGLHLRRGVQGELV